MRALIVHGYGNGVRTLSKQCNFIYLVQSTFDKFVSGDVQFEVRDYRDLSDFIPEEPPNLSEISTTPAFEHLDFVFVDANAKNAPWGKSARQMCFLIQACQVMEKCLFACNLGALAMCYLSSCKSGLIRVINGKEQGDIEIDFNKYKCTRSNAPDGELLESSSGNVYRYSKVENQWVLLINTGVHRHGISLTHGIYRAPTILNERSIKHSLSEISIQKLKTQYSHWIFNDLSENDFLVPISRSWNIHDPRKGGKLLVLADSTHGTELFEWGHMIGLNFGVTEHYPQTMKLIANFVAQKLTLLAKYDRLHFAASNTPLNQSSFQSRPKKGADTSIVVASIPPKTSVNSILSVSRKKELSYHNDSIDFVPIDSGIAKRSVSRLVSSSPVLGNTSVTGQVYRYSGETISKIDSRGRSWAGSRAMTPCEGDVMSKEGAVTQYCETEGKVSFGPSGTDALDDSRPKSAPLADFDTSGGIRFKANHAYGPRNPKALSIRVAHPLSRPNSQMRHKEIDRSSYDANSRFLDNQSSAARDSSYPSRDAMRYEKSILDTSALSETQTPGMNDSDQRITISPTSKPFTAYRKYEKLSQSTPDRFSHPIRHVGPYVSNNDKDRLEMIENRRKWLGPDFSTLSHTRDASMRALLNTQSPSPSGLHKIKGGSRRAQPQIPMEDLCPSSTDSSDSELYAE